MRRSPWPTPVLLLVAGCAGVAPRPEQANAAGLARVELDSTARAACAAASDRAIAAVRDRRFADAAAAAAAALAIDPRAARARAVHGFVLLQEARRESPPTLATAREGEVQIELARQLAPDDALVGWLRSAFFAESGHISAAAAAAEQALVDCPAALPDDRAALLLAAGSHRYELGEDRAAVPHLQAYLTLRPDDALAHFRLGTCLLRMAEVPRGPAPNSYLVAQRQAVAAARSFQRCHELAPDDFEAAMAVATAHVRAADLAGQQRNAEQRDQHLEAAATWLAAIAARHPHDPEPRFRLGVIAGNCGRAADAQAFYVEALERNAAHTGSLLNLAALLAAEGNRTGAAALLQRLSALDALAPVLDDRERRRIRAWLDRHGAPAAAEQTAAAPSADDQSSAAQAPRML